MVVMPQGKQLEHVATVEDATRVSAAAGIMLTRTAITCSF